MVLVEKSAGDKPYDDTMDPKKVLMSSLPSKLNTLVERSISPTAPVVENFITRNVIGSS